MSAVRDFEWHFQYFSAWARANEYTMSWFVGGLGEKRFHSIVTQLAWEAYWLGVEHPRSCGTDWQKVNAIARGDS